MPRLPFDASRIPDADDRGGEERLRPRALRGREGDDELTVSELAELIRTTLEREIAPLTVVGQVGNLSTPGHWYFSLKDEHAVVSCVAWASAARRFGFVPAAGDEVLATGHVSHYPPQGRTQFYVNALRPVGAGALQLRFQRMCEALRALGYFEEARKRPLPVLPRRIAVITSAGGAAIHDVIDTAARRCRAVGLLVVDVRVQGEGAAEEIARAIRWVDAERERLGVDAILVTRGGGSEEDLWAFNERVVADAAFACRLPLVAAIGHESDTTVIELVADLRAATPTQAAMRLIPAAEELLRQLGHQAARLTLLVRRRLDRAGERARRLERDLSQILHRRVALGRAGVERLAARLAHLRPARLVAGRHERLAVLSDRLDRAVRARLDQRPRLAALADRLRSASRRRVTGAAHRLGAIQRELAAVDPRLVLRRGYTYTTSARGEVIRSIAEVKAGEELITHVADGAIESVTRRTRPAADAPPEPADSDSAQEPTRVGRVEPEGSRNSEDRPDGRSERSNEPLGRVEPEGSRNSEDRPGRGDLSAQDSHQMDLFRGSE